MANAKNTQPATPATVNPPKSRATCACGCKGEVAPRRLWLPGHDARAAGVAARAIFDGTNPKAADSLPTPALQVKARNLAAKWTEAAEDKARRAAAREAAKATKA